MKRGKHSDETNKRKQMTKYRRKKKEREGGNERRIKYKIGEQE